MISSPLMENIIYDIWDDTPLMEVPNRGSSICPGPQDHPYHEPGHAGFKWTGFFQCQLLSKEKKTQQKKIKIKEGYPKV